MNICYKYNLQHADTISNSNQRHLTKRLLLYQIITFFVIIWFYNERHLGSLPWMLQEKTLFIFSKQTQNAKIFLSCMHGSLRLLMYYVLVILSNRDQNKCCFML